MKVLAKKINTKDEGVFYKEIIDDNNKVIDKVFIIRFRDENKDKLKTIGRYSEGIRQSYCKEKRNEILTKLRLGEDLPIKYKKRNVITINDLAQVYFEDKDIENKSNSKLYGKYKLHIKPLFGNIDIEKFTKDSVLKFRNSLVKRKKANQTINGIIVLLNSIINYSIKEKDLKFINPCNGLKRLKTDSNRERFLDSSEIQKLITKIQNDELLTLFVRLALTTGGRLETVLNIRKKDLNLSNSTITLKDIKNNDSYKGFIDDELEKYLLSYIENLELNDFLIGAHNTKYPTTSIQRKLKVILDDLFNQGLEVSDRKNRVVIHTLRHTFASHLAINGTPIFTIQKLMNHSDINMTLRYAKLSPDSGKDMVKKLYF